MQLTTIPLVKTGKFSELILDYLNNRDKLSGFIAEKVNLENFKKQITDKNFSKQKREILVKRLTTQYNLARIDVPSNVHLLKNENTYTVTTGHQLCLLGGPQYFIHKIVSTIKLSIQLKKAFPENDFVPVFWLASEDHDFDEINDVKFFKNNLKIDKGYDGPVGRLRANIFSTILQELKEILGDSKNESEIIDLFTRAYASGSLSIATSKWVNELFRNFGLVILDGDDIELKRSFIPVIKDELVNRNSIDAILKSSGQLNELGYNSQVSPREINLFYIENNIRERIVFQKDKFLVLNTELSFSEEEILDLLESNPDRFSPNVVLRPVYQEYILPNLAYVGGPGEIAYWLQLKLNFDRLRIEYPLLIIRDTFLLLDAKQVSNFQNLGFVLEDAFKKEHILIKDFLKLNSKEDIVFEKEEIILNELKLVLLNKVKKVDDSLSGMIQAEMTKLNKFFDKLESRIIKAEKNRQEVSVNKILKFRNTILPNDVLVERHESFIPNYLKYGSEYFDWLLEYSNVFDPQLKVLVK